MVPGVLIVHTLLWPNAARLAMAFRTADCQVHALCRRNHPMRRLSIGVRLHIYHPFAPLRSLRGAIELARPDFLIPCDDPAVALILELYSRLEGTTSSGKRTRALIEQSLGNPDSYKLAAARDQFAAIASRAGVLAPRTDRVTSFNEVEQWLDRQGFPALLKANDSWGGNGVVVIRSLKEAKCAYRKMSGSRNLARVVKRLVWNQEPQSFLQIQRAASPILSIQAYVRGGPGNCSVACWQGEVIGIIGVEVLATQSPTGIATVVRLIDNTEMFETARSVAKRLGVSGFLGLDFVLEEESGRPYLIEINPRATQINHLALGPGRDLAAALRARFAGEPIRERRAVTNSQLIALFPQEWRRNPTSSFFLTAYQDLPQNEPELVKEYTAGRGSMRRIMARAPKRSSVAAG
jgi:predicted ATP-grasp superfamily ATP-dependent carboligase